MRVGDSLILLDKSCNKTRGRVSQGIIEKIGRTYFYARVNHDLVKVTIQDFPIVTEDYNFIIFDSQESYDAYIQHQDNLKKLEVVTKNLNLLTPDQVKQILQISDDDFTNDDYETPDWLAAAMANLVLPTDREILEPFAGSGQIAKYLPSDRLVECVEIKNSRFLQGKDNAPFATWVNGNFFNDASRYGFDLIISNPPFSLCVEAVAKSLELLNDSSNSRLLFLMPLDWNCSQGRANAWESLDAHIHHIYPLSTRIDYLKNGAPMSKQQKIINGVPQFKNGKPIMSSGRQCYDAVFDIRLGKTQSAQTLIFKP